MNRQVTTKYGKVEGIASRLPDVTLFKGVPIGSDTSGKNRFMPPQKPEPWQGVHQCSVYGNRFVQSPHGNPPGSFYYNEFYYDDAHRVPISENGLSVNIYAPDHGENLPVYVYFHGGAMIWGYASEREFCAEKLAASGVVVVLAQYRLGFMGMYTHEQCSNISVRDAVFDLEWVRDNIAAFGGAPDKVTIGGQSAGAGMVRKLLACKKARGLFRSAILHSGFTGLAPFTTGKDCMEPPELCARWNERIRQVFGRDMTFDELQQLDWHLLMEDESKLWYSLRSDIPQIAIDGEYFTTDSLSLSSAQLDGINIIIGGTSDEFTSLFETSREQAHLQSEETMAHYIETVRSLNTDTRIYAYYFAHVPPGRDEDSYGAFHSCELWYAFGSLCREPGQRYWRESDFEMSDIFMGYLSAFIASGSPNALGLPVWETCSADNGYAVCELKDGSANITTRFGS